ncbi:MAG: hypothetical protein ABR502_07160 [Chitinophagaceae bacterium]
MVIKLFTALFISIILLPGFECDKKNELQKCYKGRLEIKGICMNYTISVQGEGINIDLIEKTWTDSHTGKTYQNVFALGSPCNFPADIKEGDEFYFKIKNAADENCAVCMAYYPKPEKALVITVFKSGCNE